VLVFGECFLYTGFIQLVEYSWEEEMTEMTEVENRVPMRCEVCGRQDATVRYVVYPYVFSFVVMTFQRAWAGCWCRLHRIQRWLAASLITAIFGWLGIPYGLLFTPVRLLQLAQGGLQDKNLNSQIMRAIGEELLRKGDHAGAIRCFENSLMYVDEPEVREMLRKLYGSQQTRDESSVSGLIAVFAFFTMPLLFAGFGVLVGLLDFGVNWFSSALFSEFPIYLIILVQVPLVLSIFFCVILLSYTIQGITGWARIASSALLLLAGVVTALAFINAIIGGETLGLYFAYFINGFRESINEMLITLAAIFTRAGPYMFRPESFKSNAFGKTLLAVILLLTFIFVLLLLLPKIKEHATRQFRLQGVRQPGDPISDRSHIGGWLGLGGFLAMGVLLFMAVPQKSHIDTLEAFDHVNAALNHMNANEYEPAIAEYELAVNLEPDFPISYIGLGYAHYFSGDYDQARKNFEHAVSLQPDSLEAHTGLGWTYSQQEDHDLARQEFNQVLSVDPQNLDSHLGLGWLYLNEFDLENSRKEFEYVKSMAPENAEAYYGLGALELFVSDYESTIDLLDEALRLNPGMTFAHVYKGYAYFRQGKYSAAESAFQSALKMQPGNYLALNGLGDIRVQDYAFEEGMGYYDQAIAADPERVDAYLNRAYILYWKGEFDEAVSVIEPFAEKDGRVKPFISLASYSQDYAADGDKFLRESISFSEGLEGFEQVQAYFAVAVVEFSLSDFTEAKRYGELAAKRYPDVLDAHTYFFMAQVYSALGDFDRAQTALENASGIGHSETSLHVARARLLIDQEKLNEAERELSAAIEIDDRDSDAHTLLSFVDYQQGDVRDAVVDAKTAVALNPYNSYAHAQLAYAYQEMGMTYQAAIEAQEAVRLNPLVDTFHFILGVCYMESGSSDEAIVEFEKFLDQYWDRAYIREYKAQAEEYLSQLRQSP
jgi:tetratricopeptide (TPR) repeat protein